MILLIYDKVSSAVCIARSIDHADSVNTKYLVHSLILKNTDTQYHYKASANSGVANKT